MYVDSTKVLVFPTTKRDAKGKLLSEQAMTRFITSTVDFNSGSVVNPDDKFTQIRDYELSEWGTAPFEFFIEGYYFKVDNFATIAGTNPDVYAYIKLDLVNPDYPEIKGQDEGGVYKGVEFVFNSTDIPQPEGDERVCYLQLLKNGKVPLKAFAHTKSIGVLNIDGGEI